MKKIGLLYLMVSVFCFVSAQKAELILPIGHIDKINSISFSNDNKYILSGSCDQTAKIWEVKTGKELRTFSGHTQKITSVCFSADGKNIFTASSDKTIKQWNVETGAEINTYLGNTSGVNSIVVSSDKKFLISGSDDKTVKVWEIGTSNVKTFAGHLSNVTCLAISPDCKKVYSGSSDKTIKIWDLQSGKEIKSIQAHDAEVTTIDISSNGKFLVSGSSDKTIKIWDLQNGMLLKTLIGSNDKISSVCFSNDCRSIISGGKDNTVRIWDFEKGTEKQKISKFSNEVSCVRFSKNDKTFIAASFLKNKANYENDQNDITVNYNGIGTIDIFNIGSSSPFYTFRGHSAWVNNLSLSDDGKRLITGSYNKQAKLWDLTTGKQIRNFSGQTDCISSVAISPNNDFALTGSIDKTTWLWDLSNGKVKQTFASNDFITSIKFLDSGQKVLLGTAGEEVNSYNISSAAIDNKYKVGIGINSIAVDSKNEKIATASFYGLSIFDKKTGDLLKNINNHKDGALCVAFSADSKFLASGGADKLVKLYDANSFKEIFTFTGHTDEIYGIAFSDDGNIIASASNDYTVKLWDVKTGKLLKTLSGHKKEVEAVGFIKGSKFLFSGSQDNTTKIWDVSSGAELCSLISIDTNDWVVVTPSGLFDASTGAMNQMHYIVGLESIALEQLKDRYYEPGLLQKILGFKEESIRNVQNFNEVKIYPNADASQIDNATGNLMIDLKNQGGGIGKVVVYINGKEIASDARGEKADPNSKEMKLNLKLKNHPYILPDKENKIEIKAYNADGSLVSRGVVLVYDEKEKTPNVYPNLFIVASGISDYEGDKIDLKFAAKDAEDIANTLELASSRLFGNEKTFTYLLTTNKNPIGKFQSVLLPTKANLLKTFEDIAKVAKSTDVIVVYLSGHGVNWGGQDGDFYYLTQNAYSASAETYSDPVIRKNCTVSSAELTELIKKVPALKQVLIIDACASGRMVKNLISKRDISSSTLRALDRMKDRTGMHIITGCAADAVSYETSRFGQGILTYSILEGIKGTALREGKFIDVSTLFQKARDRVPELAIGIGGIQKPEVFSPYGAESFDIGELNDEDKTKINLAQEKPMVLLTNFQDENSLDDNIGLEKVVDETFRNEASKDSKFVFVDTKDFPGAYRIRGQYHISNKTIKLKVNVFVAKDLVKTFELSQSQAEIQILSDKILENVKLLWK
ncbi:MAG: caspase family protein [Bacteroidetes bacterium]|nr:caspase family protein [Bacteroidota bacterium]